MNDLVSVVIPVYKVEDYLERCVNSVLSQDFRDLEVVLVDDGSPDRCPEICDEFARRDERVRVIHKPNGGLSSARNAGIEVAKGEFIAFLDSDDQWAEAMLSPIMSKVLVDKPNMTLFKSYSVYENGEKFERRDGGLFNYDWRILDRNKFYDEVIKLGDMQETAYTKILKMEFVKANDLTFTQGILGEDTEWMFRILRGIDRVALSPEALVLYTPLRVGSITRTVSVKKVTDVLYTIKKSIGFYNINEDLGTKYYELAQCAYLWSSCIALVSALPKAERENVKREMLEIKKNLDLKSHPKSRMVNIVYQILGFELTSRIMGMYLTLHRKNILNRKTKVNG